MCANPFKLFELSCYESWKEVEETLVHNFLLNLEPKADTFTQGLTNTTSNKLLTESVTQKL